MNVIDMSSEEYQEILYLKQILDELMLELKNKDDRIQELEKQIDNKRLEDE